MSLVKKWKTQQHSVQWVSYSDLDLEIVLYWSEESIAYSSLQAISQKETVMM